MSRVLGMDVSLNSTGFAGLVDLGLWKAGLLKPTDKTLRSWVRVDDVLCQFEALMDQFRPDLVVFENYALSRVQGMVELVEMGTVLRREVGRRGIPIMEVSPSALKKFATGNGAAKKPQVIAAVKALWGFETKNSDQADARVLAQMGLATIHPPTMRQLSLAQSEVMGKVPRAIICCNQLH